MSREGVIRLAELTAQQWAELEMALANCFVAVENINRRHSAYGLKQKFSREHFYVTQEQFTRAMQSIGFHVEPFGNGNAHFNIGERSPYFE